MPDIKDAGRNEATSIDNVIIKLDEALRPQILHAIENSGFREAMLAEYGELADAVNQLLGMFEKYGFAEKMNNDDRGEYELLLSWLGVCARRCKIIAEESDALDDQAFLLFADPATDCIN